MKYKAAFDFIFRKRYWIGACLLIILVAGGFHTSSIGNYELYIQPGLPVESAQPILGQNRTIRSDEWAVSTPTLLSQIPNNLEEDSTILNGYSENVTFYPKLIAKSPSALTTPNELGFFFLPPAQAFSFTCFFGYFLLFFATLEFLMLLTRGNRLFSTAGAIMITFAPAVQWWDAWNTIAYGELAIVLFDKFLRSNKLYQQLLLSLLIGIIGSCYIMILYPAWQVPYGFVFLLLAIWIIKNNKHNCNFKKFFILFAIVIAAIAILIIPSFIKSQDVFQLVSNTVYPGARLTTGGTNSNNLFNYYASIFTAFKPAVNASEMSQFVSLFPIPIIMGIYYWWQNRKTGKKDFLLVSLIILSILLCVWNFVELPTWLAKISLLSFSLPTRTALTVGFISIILLIYCLSQYTIKKVNNTQTKYQYFIIALLSTILGIVAVCNNEHYVETGYMETGLVIFDLIFFTIVSYLCLLNTAKTGKISIILLTVLTFISGVLVHPLCRNLDIIYEKPIAKAVQKIEQTDPDAKWLVVAPAFPATNYIIASGADTINSTNYYPNFELWNKLGLGDQEYTFNRYAHIVANISTEPSSISDRYDQIFANINNEDVCKIDINYIFAQNKDLDQYDSNIVDFIKLYDEDGFSIYQVICSDS